MARTEDHIALANRHQETLSALLADGREHPEWITTIAFYKALQIVDACLVTLGMDAPSDHGSRSDMLKRTSRLDHIARHYWVLENAASVARYLADTKGKKYRTFSDYLPPGQMVRHRLAQIESSARKILRKLDTLVGATSTSVPHQDST